MSENKSKAKGNLNKLLDPHVEYVTRNFFAGLASFWFGECRWFVCDGNSNSNSNFYFWLQDSRVHIFCRNRFGSVCHIRRNFRWGLQLLSDRRQLISSSRDASIILQRIPKNKYVSNVGIANHRATSLLAARCLPQSTCESNNNAGDERGSDASQFCSHEICDVRDPRKSQFEAASCGQETNRFR